MDWVIKLGGKKFTRRDGPLKSRLRSGRGVDPHPWGKIIGKLGKRQKGVTHSRIVMARQIANGYHVLLRSGGGGGGRQSKKGTLQSSVSKQWV